MFLEQIPEEVTLLDTSPLIETLTGKISLNLLKNKTFSLKGLITRIRTGLKIRSLKLFQTINEKNVSPILWKIWNPVIPQLNQEAHETAIAYIHGIPLFFLIDKVKADKKIGWIHTDYKKAAENREFEKYYFRKLDQINTVSPVCRNSFLKFFGDLRGKVTVVENKISKRQIYSMAEESIDEELKFTDETIVSVGRLSEEKGIHIAAKAASILVSKGYPIIWYIIGSGDERKKLENQIKSLQLKDHFILLGERSNPYPYMKKAAIYVQPSIYEGKSVTVEEAKVLNKTILVTDYETLRMQMEGYPKGNICKASADDMAAELERLLKGR